MVIPARRAAQTGSVSFRAKVPLTVRDVVVLPILPVHERQAGVGVATIAR
jgi:hypothetical protein